MEIFQKILNDRFGEWTLKNQLLCNCDLSDYYAGMYLNVAFQQTGCVSLRKIFDKEHVRFGEKLGEFYTMFNGLTFFCHSLVIYGNSKMIKKGYCPLDGRTMNNSLRIKYPSWNDALYSIGSYSNFEFCIQRKSKSEAVFVIDRHNFLKTIAIFENIESLLEYCVRKISSFYDSKGIKKGNDIANGNWMNNMSFDNIF